MTAVTTVTMFWTPPPLSKKPSQPSRSSRLGRIQGQADTSPGVGAGVLIADMIVRCQFPGPDVQPHRQGIGLHIHLQGCRQLRGRTAPGRGVRVFIYKNKNDLVKKYVENNLMKLKVSEPITGEKYDDTFKEYLDEINSLIKPFKEDEVIVVGVFGKYVDDIDIGNVEIGRASCRERV